VRARGGGLVGAAGHVVRLEGDELVLDAREGAAAVSLRVGADVIAIGVGGGRCTIAEVARVELRDVPEVDAVLGGRTADDAMIRRARGELETRDPLRVAAALGTIARLWSAPDAPSRKAAEALRSPTPREVVRAWAKTLPRDAVDSLAKLASARGTALLVDLEAIESTSIDDAEARGRALEAVLARDDLESIAFVVRAAGASIDESTNAVDRFAEALFSELCDALAPIDDAVVRAVSWQEPDAWWGRLAIE
jgi:hypothetical protein